MALRHSSLRSEALKALQSPPPPRAGAEPWVETSRAIFREAVVAIQSKESQLCDEALTLGRDFAIVRSAGDVTLPVHRTLAGTGRSGLAGAFRRFVRRQQRRTRGGSDVDCDYGRRPCERQRLLFPRHVTSRLRAAGARGDGSFVGRDASNALRSVEDSPANRTTRSQRAVFLRQRQKVQEVPCTLSDAKAVVRRLELGTQLLDSFGHVGQSSCLLVDLGL